MCNIFVGAVAALSFLFAGFVSAQTIPQLFFDHTDPANYPTLQIDDTPIILGMSMGEEGILQIHNVGDGDVTCFGLDIHDKPKMPTTKFEVMAHSSFTFASVPLHKVWLMLCFSEDGTEVAYTQRRGFEPTGAGPNNIFGR